MISKKFFSGSGKYTTLTDYVPAPYIRKSFVLEKEYEKPVLTITALGYYRVFINGQEITKGFLAPYTSNPEHIIAYDVYDLSAYLKKGENVIGLILGNGYQNGVGGYVWDEHLRVGRNAPAFALCIDSGEEVILEGNESFKWAHSAILFDDMRLGEIYDANKEIEGWNEIGFDDSKWENVTPLIAPHGEKILGYADPIKERKRLYPVAITKYKEGYLYDFGENTSAIVELNIDADKGQEIECLYGEWITAAGELDIRNITLNSVEFDPIKTFAQETKYICKEGKQTHIPSFTYHGFRYIYVKGLKEEQATKELFTAIVINSAVEQAGDFKCSDETINKIYGLCTNSAYTNFFYYPLDCPHREKNGWTGDANVSAEYMLYRFYADNSLRQWLHAMRNTMRNDGNVPSIVPDSDWGYSRNDGPAWDTVLVELPYTLYCITQDITYLSENAEKIFKYITYISNTLEDGLITYGLSDWCQPPFLAWENKTPIRVSSSLLAYRAVCHAMEMFEKLNLKKEYIYSKALAEEMKTAIREKLIDFESYEVEGSLQCCQALGIWCGIFEEDEKAKAFEVLLRMIREKDNHLDVGILGVKSMFDVLSEFGYTDLAYDMITADTYPSYAYMLKQGATSLWENFNTDEEMAGENGKRATSLNHHMFGSVSAWFVKYLGGIKFNFDGSIDINPMFTSRIDAVDANVRGIFVSWKRENGNVIFDADYNKELYSGREVRINK